MSDLKEIKNNFSISSFQEEKLKNFILELKRFNKHTNIVGKSTLTNPWKSHILDCIQISSFIDDKNSSILDMGTGAGLPGLVLAMVGYKNVNLVDSNGKKINFVRFVCNKLNLKANIFLDRIEVLKKEKYNFLTSRALANLNKLFTYSHKFLNHDTVLIFLKGKTVNYEILKAKENWIFSYELFDSISGSEGKIVIIKGLKRK